MTVSVISDSENIFLSPQKMLSVVQIIDKVGIIFYFVSYEIIRMAIVNRRATQKS